MAGPMDPNPPFVPSPRWLSESPARHPSSSNQGTPAHISYSGEPLPRAPPSFRGDLRSPAPPPPANLYKANATAFNVDPGVPFLATAGPSDAGSDNGSIQESPRERIVVGGLVTSIKNVVRRSLRDSTRSRRADADIYNQPPQFRDSGYGASTPQFENPPPLRNTGPQPVPPHLQSPPSSRHTFDSPRAFSATLLGDHDGRRHELQDDATIIEHRRILSPEAGLMSPVSAEPDYGSDYAQMDFPTPPPSAVSFNTYMQRAQNFLRTVNKLPWVAKERVTSDYYPEKTRRKDEPKHHPAISWHSQNYSRPNYRASAVGTPPPSDASSAFQPSPNPIFITPQRRSYADMNLDDEFETNTPLPQNPPQFTPQTNRMHGTSLAEAGGVLLSDPGPMPLYPPVSAPSSTGQYVPPPIVAIPDEEPRQSPTDQPPGGQGEWADAVWQAQHPPMGMPANFDPQTYNSRPIFPPPPGQPRSTYAPSQNYYPSPPAWQPSYSPSQASSRSRPPPGQPPGTYTPPQNDYQDPNPPPQHSSYPPSRASSRSQHRVADRIQTPGRSSGHNRAATLPATYAASPSGPEWQEYPREMGGYVPYERSENYYGDQYGPGIHVERPPMAPPVSGPPSIASTRRR